MRKAGFIFALLSVIACGRKELSRPVAKGEAVYGGEIWLMTKENILALSPGGIDKIYESRVMHQLFDPMLIYDTETGTIQPSVISSYKISEDLKVYTLIVRDNVFFHDDKCFKGGLGRKVEADDIRFSIEQMCSGKIQSRYAQQLASLIAGGLEYRDKTKKIQAAHHIRGIELIDEKTLKIVLEKEFVNFEKLLTHSGLLVLAKEAYDYYGKEVDKHPVGTGPFYLSSWQGNQLVLKAFSKYWKTDEHGNRLPFVDQVNWSYNIDSEDQLKAFREGRTDMILEIQADEIENTVGTLKEAKEGKNVKHKIFSTNSLGIHFLTFNHITGPFADERVRKAILLGIDRKKIIKECLKGEGNILTHGFVPTLKDYDGEVSGYIEYNIEKARDLLRQAGFPGGNNFPEIELVYEQPGNKTILSFLNSIRKELSLQLNIRAKIVSRPAGFREVLARPGLVYNSWVADYSDPFDFLQLFNEKETALYYDDTEYRLLLEKAAKEQDLQQRNQIFSECDQLLIDKAYVVPMYSDDLISIVNARIRNYEINGFELADFSRIYIREYRK